MKRAVTVAIAFIISIATMLSASAAGRDDIKTDGINSNNREWFDYLEYKESISKPLNSSKYIGGSYVPAFEENSDVVFLLITASFSTEKTEKTGFILSLEGKEYPPVTFADHKNNEKFILGSDEKFIVTAAFGYTDDLVIELKIECNDGAGREINGAVKFTDGEGNFSHSYNLKLKNPYYTEPASAETVTEKTTLKSSKKTTTAVTSKTHRAHKSDSTRRTTVRNTTNDAKTDSPENTSQKIKNTKAKSSKSSQKAEKNTGMSVAYYEKEIIITEITITDTTEAETDNSIFDFSSMPKSTQYKIAVGASALILFLIIGIWAVRTGKDAASADKENKKDEE